MAEKQQQSQHQSQRQALNSLSAIDVDYQPTFIPVDIKDGFSPINYHNTLQICMEVPQIRHLMQQIQAELQRDGNLFGIQQASEQKDNFPNYKEKHPILFSLKESRVLCTLDSVILDADYRDFEPYLVYLAPYRGKNFYIEMRDKSSKNLEKFNESSEFQQLVSRLESLANPSVCIGLMHSLNENLTWLGGPTRSFTLEKKTRTFIDEILKHVCRQISGPISTALVLLDSSDAETQELSEAPILRRENPVFTDLELELKIFGELVKPDYVLMRRNLEQERLIDHQHENSGQKWPPGA